MYVCVSGRMDGWQKCWPVCIYGWMDRWMNGRMNGWMDEQTDEWMALYMYRCICVSMYVSIYLYICIIEEISFQSWFFASHYVSGVCLFRNLQQKRGLLRKPFIFYRAIFKINHYFQSLSSFIFLPFKFFYQNFQKTYLLGFLKGTSFVTLPVFLFSIIKSFST